MNSHTDLSFACLNVVDAMNGGEDLRPAVQLLSEICRRDPIISAQLSQLAPEPLPNFNDRPALYSLLRQALADTAIAANPNYLLAQLFQADNCAELIANFPDKLLLSRGIVNFALSLKAAAKN